MLMLLWLPRSNTVLIWSQRNLDLIKDNCGLVTLKTGYIIRDVSSPSAHTLITFTAPGDLDWQLPPGSQHQIQADKEERVVNREFRIFCRGAFPSINCPPSASDWWCMKGHSLIFVLCWKLRRAFCPVSEMEPFSFINPAFPALTIPQWLYKRRVVNGSIPQFYFHNLRCDRL